MLARLFRQPFVIHFDTLLFATYGYFATPRVDYLPNVI